MENNKNNIIDNIIDISTYKLNRIKIGNSGVHSKGIFATEFIPAGEIILFEKYFEEFSPLLSGYFKTMDEIIKDDKRCKLISILSPGDKDKTAERIKDYWPIIKEIYKEKKIRDLVYGLSARIQVNSFEIYSEGKHIKNVLFHYGARFNNKFIKPNASFEFIKKSCSSYSAEYLCIWTTTNIEIGDEIFIKYIKQSQALSLDDIVKVYHNWQLKGYGNVPLITIFNPLGKELTLLDLTLGLSEIKINEAVRAILYHVQEYGNLNLILPHDIPNINHPLINYIFLKALITILFLNSQKNKKLFDIVCIFIRFFINNFSESLNDYDGEWLDFFLLNKDELYYNNLLKILSSHQMPLEISNFVDRLKKIYFIKYENTYDLIISNCKSIKK